MDLLKVILIISLFLFGCASSNSTPKVGCYGYWKEDKPWRGTNFNRKGYVRPYRQCVEENTPYRNLFPD
tara:strand:+ start:777 stop:983 length:207 start_codon:yes stop_codon:yes gene_type:complete